MKLHPMKIYDDKQNVKYVLLTIKEYKQVLELLEDSQDLQDMEQQQQENVEFFPLELAKALANGAHPIKAYREHRQLSQTQLAKAVGVSKQYISQLEKGNRTGTLSLLKRIATVLNVELADITADSH